MDINEALLGKSKGYLAELVVKLLNGLEEKQRLDFIGKYIDAKIALETLTADHEDILDQEDVVQQVDEFCAECLAGAYFVDAEYDDYHDAYNEDDYKSSEWAARFAEYIRLAVIYARSGDCLTAYEMFIRIFDCVSKCEQDFEILGTDSPLSYIDLDKDDAFDVYFFTIEKVHEDRFKAYDKMFSVWSLFEHYCEPLFEMPSYIMAFRRPDSLPLSVKRGLLCKYVVDLNTATEVVIHRIKASSDFSGSERMFLMLEKLFIQRNEPFDKLEVSKRLLNCHDNFSYYVALGYFEQGQWENAIATVKTYLAKTSGNTVTRLRTLLTDCYEKNGQPREAYDNALSMFYDYKSYDLYKRTRALAEQLDSVGVDLFFELSRDHLLKGNGVDARTVYAQILSFEGKTKDLAGLSRGMEVSENYYLLKYSAKALVYRVLKGKAGLPPNLSEYITSIINSELPGIVDMLPRKDDDINARDILSSAINILQEQIQFHIDAATRSRYAKAAYYLGVVVDIHQFLGEADQGDAYVFLLMAQNNRRPAFKDELRKKLEG